MTLTIEQIDKAIEKVLVNQNYTLDGITYTRASLASLNVLREQILKTGAASTNSASGNFDRLFSVSVIPKRNY